MVRSAPSESKAQIGNQDRKTDPKTSATKSDMQELGSANAGARIAEREGPDHKKDETAGRISKHASVRVSAGGGFQGVGSRSRG